VRRAVLIAALVAAAACGKGADEEAPAEPVAPPPLSEAAATQLRAACDVYVAHVCGCAAAQASDAALAEQCGLARAIPEALDLSIGAAQATNNSALNQTGLLANVNKIQKNCVEQSARLETRCPRASVAPAGATPAAPPAAATP
jgi:hypothetical protein